MERIKKQETGGVEKIMDRIFIWKMIFRKNDDENIFLIHFIPSMFFLYQIFL